jgi:four helix bundle protein
VLVKRLPRLDANIIDGRQLLRASGSVGANYIEANEALSRKDFIMRAKISRKEAKECRWFLRLLDTGGDPSLEAAREDMRKAQQDMAQARAAMAKAQAELVT